MMSQQVGELAPDCQFHPAVQLDDLNDGTSLGLILNGWPVLIARSGEAVHAVIDRCSHAASNLRSGKIRRGAVMCPLHGARFDLATGSCVGGVYSALKVFPVRVENGWIEVEVPNAAPDADFAPV